MTGLKAIRSNLMAAARRKYSAEGVARAMGVSAPTYHKWEEHPERMTMEQARRLADYLGCHVEDLFYLPGKHN